MVWGGSYLVTIRNSELEKILEGSIDTIANAAIPGPDWIMDVALFPENPDKFALITAHNTVFQARLDNSSNTLVIDTPSSPARSILYSAHILWESSSSLLVAAGTVFGEIITWKCDITGVSEVLYTFTGHEGSIFGVNISQPITFPDKTVGRLLASCSDDRTIRVWKFVSDLVKKSHGEESVLSEGGSGDRQAVDEVSKSGLIATIMGHASRIWGVKFVVRKSDEDAFDNVSILSFGEDSTTQHWTLDFGSYYPETSFPQSQSEPVAVPDGKLYHQNTFGFHGGKHIFSSALLSTSEQDFKVVTGGADGKIIMYDIEHKSTKDVSRKTQIDRPASWDLQEIIQSCSPDSKTAGSLVPAMVLPVVQIPVIDPKSGKLAKIPKVKKIPIDALNCYGFIAENQFVMTTTFGRVFSGKIDSYLGWQELFFPVDSPHDLKSYSIIAGYPELGLAFLAAADGRVYIYRNGDQLREVANLGRKIADMFKIHDHISNGFQLLVTTVGGQVATLFVVEDSSLGHSTLQKISEYKLPEKFVVTSAGRIKDMLLLGSRVGSLALYSEPNTPLCIWTRPTGSAPESITSIIPVLSQQGSSHVLTTDRDGKFSVFSCSTTLSDDNQTIISASLTPVHHGHPSFGPMIENAWFSNNELILYGFRSKSFVVWNHTRQIEISNIDCGGAHRSYAYSPLSASGGGHFIYTKGSKLYIHTQNSLSHEIVKKGGHGREIKASAVSPNQRCIATGAEDTEIRLWNYDPSSKIAERLSCQAIVQKHTAGIQHLKFHGDYLFSSGGYEELFIFSISQIPNFGVGIVCEASNPDHTPDRDLRIMNFDVSDYPDADGMLLISLAFSDSTFKSYAYLRAAGFTLVAKGRYTSSCLMQIKHLRIGNGEVNFLTAATDGRLVVWKHALPSPSSISTSEPVSVSQISSLKIHQSSVKALDLIGSRDEKRTVIITGGDDNAIAVTVYCKKDLTIPPKSFILRSAHAAAVTGISFIPSSSTIASPEGKEKFVFATSSNDQRVKQWAVILTSTSMSTSGTGLGEEFGRSLEIKQLDDAFTAVADVGDVCVLRCEGMEKVLVVGNGMEVWDVRC